MPCPWPWSPVSALEQLEYEWDLVIMDLRFLNCAGEQDAREGLALIRRIREKGSAVPVVVLPGGRMSCTGGRRRRWSSRVMVKPVTTHELLAAVADLV